MRPADVAAVLAVATIGAGLALGDLSDGARIVAVLLGFSVVVAVNDRRRAPLGLAGVFVVAILAPADVAATMSLILGVALVGHAAGSLLPALSVGDTERLRAALDEFDAEVVDREALADLIDKEVARAQRHDDQVAVMALALQPHAHIAPVVESLRRVLRTYDVIAYEPATARVFVVAVAPTESAQRSVQAKVLGAWGVEGVGRRSYPDDGMTALDLLSVLEGRRRAVGREAA